MTVSSGVWDVPGDERFGGVPHRGERFLVEKLIKQDDEPSQGDSSFRGRQRRRVLVEKAKKEQSERWEEGQEGTVTRNPPEEDFGEEPESSESNRPAIWSWLQCLLVVTLGKFLNL